ncbi:cis-L-3-hydroxyproline dehydratase [Geosmithia morbida]|uniref:Cis-L-3-hydroxyproline dehydratase n=1 Tax=Geosmithia morbida TaxID=1094350 RepID=A0A9P4YU05_9HYPO|nr:cis-L-3-hydroxyproline dehydratase [Geosmithia morbida]KAF4123066.1 cis-L-3-hydroxyproline dehydratase [Geosmithia morbida]
MAMEILVQLAAVQGATSLIDVSRVYIDACVCVGETSLLIPQRLLDRGGKFVVPTTCSSLRDDQPNSADRTADSSDGTINLVSLGNPDLTLPELALVAKLCAGKAKADDTQLMLVTNRHVCGQAAKHSYVDAVEAFSARIVTDTCWCMIEPVISVKASAKHTHYGPEMTGRGYHFGSIQSWIRAA